MLTRLLLLAGLCTVGTLNGAILGSATGTVLGIVTNILSNDLDSVWNGVAKRLEGKDAVLRNQDLSKAVGKAIAAVIASVAREKQFDDYREPLKILANRAANDWSKILEDPKFQDDLGFDPVRETNLALIFSQKAADFSQVRALTPQDWEKLLNTWQEKDLEAMRDSDVMRYVAEKLHTQFPKALREVLKEDFASGGKAFSALMVDLLGDIRGAISEQQAVILARLEQIEAGSPDNGLRSALETDHPDLQSAISQVKADFQEVDRKIAELEAKNTQAFQDLASQIESGFENIENLLAGIGIQLFRIEDKVDQVLEKVTAFENALSHTATQAGILKAGNPHKSLAHWQGRVDEIERLHRWLESGNITLIGIEGIGGTGKSSLAAKIYEKEISPNPLKKVDIAFPKRFWADVGSGAIFSDLARQVLIEFGCSVPEEEARLVEALVKCLQSGQYLLVIDNLESLLEKDGQWRSQFYGDFFSAWLEYGSQSTVLVTTRERPELKGFEWISLEGLKVEEGVALLAELGIRGDLEEFVKLVDGHPLLLRLVADLLKDEYPQDSSLERLADLGLGNLRQLLTDSRVVGQHRRENVGMVLVLDASFKRLSDLQKSLLLNVSVYRGAFDAVEAKVVMGAAEVEIEQELKKLVKRSLLQKKRLFEFQPVVLEYIRYKAGDQTEAHQRAIAYYLSIAKEKPWKTLDDVVAYLAIFYHWCQLEEYDPAFKIVNACDNFLTLRGYYTVKIELYKRSLEITQTIGDRDGEASSYGNLGNAYNSLGQYQRAIDFHQQSLEIAREIGDRDGEARSYNNLGNAYNSLGQYQRAIDFHQQSLEIKQEIGDRDGEARSYGNLGNAYNSLGQYQRAIDFYQQSLEIAREIGDRNGEARSYNNLGNAYDSLGQYQGAIEFHQQSLEIAREIGDRNGEARSYNNLGNAYNSLGQYQGAIDFYQQSLEIAREIGDRNGEARSYNNLGNAYNSLGQYQGAIDFYQQSLEIAREIGDRNGEARSYGNLGNAYDSLGQYQGAIDFYQQSLEIAREIGDRRGEANAWFNLGLSLENLNREADAMGAYRNARELYQAMELDEYVQRCDNAIDRLSGPVPPPSRSGWLSRLRRWLQRVWRWIRNLLKQ